MWFYAGGGANTWLPSGQRRRLRDSERYSRRLKSVLTLPLTFKTTATLVLLNENYARLTKTTPMLLTLNLTTPKQPRLTKTTAKGDGWSVSCLRILNYIFFGTSPRLQSLSNLTSIEVAGTSISLVDYRTSSYLVSLFTNSSILISISNVGFSS